MDVYVFLLQGLNMLLKQVAFLQAQRSFLQAIAEESSRKCLLNANEKARAMQERQKRRRVEEEHRQLSTLGDCHSKSLASLQPLLSRAPILTHYRATLMTPMAAFIRLPESPMERRATLMALRDERIHTVCEFIDKQARQLDVQDQRAFFGFDASEKFGKHYSVDFMACRLNDVSVDDVLSAIHARVIEGKDMTTNRQSSSQIYNVVEYAFMHSRALLRVNTSKNADLSKSFVVRETNRLYSMKNIGNAAALVCDSINDDPVHPIRASSQKIRQDVSGGIITEPSVADNGRPGVQIKHFGLLRKILAVSSALGQVLVNDQLVHVRSRVPHELFKTWSSSCPAHLNM